MEKAHNEDKSFLGTEPIRPLMFSLSVPAILAQLINVLYNIVDRIYIGHMPEVGGLALTGLGVCTPLIIIVSAFAMLVAMGGAPNASIEMGKKNDEGAEHIMGSCVALQLVISAVLTAALLIWNRPLLLMFGASENTIGYASQYMNIYAIGTVFVQLTLGMNAFITAQGYAKVSMYTVLIGAICNIILDPIMIFGMNMGVRGAALATIISQGISCVWVIHFLTSPKSSIKLRMKNIRFDNVLLSCVALGAAPFIMQASESIISICFNSSLLKYGGDIAVGAMTILSTVMQFAMLPMQGFAQGAQPISSYNFGAHNSARVKQTFRLLLICCCTYSVLLWVAVQIFPQVFASLFTNDTAMVAYTKSALRIYAGAMFIMGVQIACQMTFISLGNAKTSIFVAVFRKFIMLVPLIYLLPMLLPDKTVAVYLAEPISDTAAVICTGIVFAKEFRKAIKKLDEGPHDN